MMLSWLSSRARLAALRLLFCSAAGAAGAAGAAPVAAPVSAPASAPVGAPMRAAAPASPRAPAAPATAAPAAAPRPLFAYIDGSGVAHVASTRVDSRYAPVLDGTGTGQHVYGKKDGPAHLLTWLEFAPDVLAVQPFIKEAAAHTGVDAELLKAVIAVESHYDTHAVSRAGAVGLMQLTPATADRYGTPGERQQPARERLLDARTNIWTGARMLADLTRRYGSIDVALAAWNAGEGTVRKAGGRVPPIAETEAHVHMVLELYWALMQRSLGAAAKVLQLHDPHETARPAH